MTAVELLEAYAQHLNDGATAFERGDEPTTDWRDGRRDFDARLRAVGDEVGPMSSRPEGKVASARWRKAGARFEAAVEARVTDVEDALGSNGRIRRGHRAYLRGQGPREARYLQRLT